MESNTPPAAAQRGAQRLPEVLAASLVAKSEALRAGGAGREELSRAACFALVQAGYNPTQALVRRITNLGSNDAISRDIEKIRGELGTVLQRRTLKTEVPEPVMTLVESMMDGLWKSSIDQARSEFDAERAQSRKEIDAAQEATRVAQGLLEAALADKSALHSQLASSADALAEAHKHVATLQAQFDELQSTVDHLRADIARERDEKAAQSTQFSSDLRATREAADRALAQAEGNRKYVLLQLDQARDSEKFLGKRLELLEADHHIREQHYKQDTNNLRDKLGGITLENGVLQGQLQAKNDELSRAVIRISDLESRLVSEAESATSKGQAAQEAAHQERIDNALTQARNAPQVFELCEERECVVHARIDSAGVLYFDLCDESGGHLFGPYKTVKELNDFCTQQLT